MKKTTRYNLNLIESTDTFSPAPLNENAELLVQALDAASAALGAEAAARTDAASAASAALSAEAKTRADADAAEVNARTAAVSAEASARANADAAEANARANAVNSEANTRASADNALSSRVTALEARRFVTGSYTGNSASAGQTIGLGFTPKAVFVGTGSPGTAAFTVTGQSVYALEIVSGGFKVTGHPTSSSISPSGSTTPYLNTNNVTYRYFAFC